jgi:hypothetical protein
VNDLTHAAAFIGTRQVLQDNDRLSVNRIVAGAGQVEIGHVGCNAADAVEIKLMLIPEPSKSDLAFGL